MTWEDAWREGRTGWDAGAAAPALVDLLADGTTPRGRALVPGCGSGYDVFALARTGYDATGLDVAPTASARFESLRATAGVDPAKARLLVSDFFEYRPDERFDFVWDYTFFCAIEPDLRAAWGRHVDALLAPGGELATLVFPLDGWEGRTDPPYRISVPMLAAALGPRFTPIDALPPERSHPGRAGYEILVRWRRTEGT
jgi:SAM-dependent methyltransferase